MTKIVSTAAFVALLTSVANGQVFGSSPINRGGLDLAFQITFIDTANLCPADGLITNWTLFAGGTGDVTLQIWRPLGGGTYQLIGANAVSVGSLGLNSFDIATGSQIAVQTGDLLGFRYNQTSLAQRVISMSQFSGGGVQWTNWPHNNTDVPIGGTLSNLVGANEQRTYSFQATVNPVPEPSSLAAVVLGALLLRRRSRSRA